MPKKVYVGVNNTARKVKKIYFGVDGTARKVKKGYIGIGGVARPFWSEGVAYYGEITALSSKKYWPGAASVDDYALVAGGSKPVVSNGINATTDTNTVDAYNKSLQRTSAPTLTTARGRTVGATLNNYAVFTGGGSVSTKTFTFAYNSALSKTNITLSSNNNSMTYYQGAVSFGNTAIFGVSGASLFLNSSLSLSRISRTYTGTNISYGGMTKVGNYAVTGCWLKVSNYVAGLSLQAFNSSGTEVQSPSSSLINKWVCYDAAYVGNYGLFFGYTTSMANSSSWESSSQPQMTWCDSSLTVQTPIARPNYKSDFGKLCTSDYAILAGGHIREYKNNAVADSVTNEVEVFDASLTVTNELKLNTKRTAIEATAQVGSYGIFAAGELSYAGSINGSNSSDIVDAFTL